VSVVSARYFRGSGSLASLSWLNKKKIKEKLKKIPKRHASLWPESFVYGQDFSLPKCKWVTQLQSSGAIWLFDFLVKLAPDIGGSGRA